jgi:hypothetical protein
MNVYLARQKASTYLGKHKHIKAILRYIMPKNSDEIGGIWNEAIVAYERHSPQGTVEDHKNLGQNIRCQIQDLNEGA